MASVADLEARAAELETEIKEIDAKYPAEQLPDDERPRWNEANSELENVRATLKELEERTARVAELATRTGNTEPAVAPSGRTNRRTSHVPDDPTRLEEYRNLSTSMDDLDQAYRDGAMKVLERMVPAHPGKSREEAQDDVSRMLDTIDLARGEDGAPRSIARRIIATSSKGYLREFGTYLRTGGSVVGKEMERAASLTTTAGGFAVPVTLDPTVILVSSGVLNPVRSLARIERITGNVWEGVSSTGITAAYSDEVTETSDNAPVLAQPTANVEKAQAFVPFSIEIGEDWTGFQSSMAMMFADAKDTLENTQFLTGLGHASHVPQGLIAVGGNTAVVTTATTAVIAAADLYTLVEALNERWQTRASIVGSRAFFDKVRQLDTAGGANLWVQLQNDNPPELLGYPAYRWSAYSAGVTTSGSTVATIGDFNQFVIIDKVGASIELIPHMFATANNRPSGQRGLYMYWRNTSKPVTPGLLANSAFVSLKVL